MSKIQLLLYECVCFFVHLCQHLRSDFLALLKKSDLLLILAAQDFELLDYPSFFGLLSSYAVLSELKSVKQLFGLCHRTEQKLSAFAFG